MTPLQSTTHTHGRTPPFLLTPERLPLVANPCAPAPPSHSSPQISCSWGFTTSGGAKGVGESTTSAVVISLVAIFIADFVLSFAFYQGQGSALKQLK
jgi:hypothetical protein